MINGNPVEECKANPAATASVLRIRPQLHSQYGNILIFDAGSAILNAIAHLLRRYVELPGSGHTRTDRIAGGLYNDILAGIVMGQYPPQSALPTETRLANDYGISRNVVRSALDLLKQSGVIESRQGSGTVVAALEPKALAQFSRDAQSSELRDCFECREGIEPEIAAVVASRLSKADRAFLEERYLCFGKEEEGTDYERSVEDVGFHIRLAEFSGNTFFISIMNQLRPHMLFAMNNTKTLTRKAYHNHINLSRLEHLKIITAILDEDSEAARSAMRRHIDSGAQRIFQKQNAWVV